MGRCVYFKARYSKNMISKETFYTLYNKNSPENKNRHIGPIDARLFLRDLSLPIAYEFAKQRVSPHVVTAFCLFLSLLGNSLLFFPSTLLIFFVFVLHEAAQLFDCVDGQLARYNGVSSDYGEEFDTLVHVLTSSTFVLCLGIHLYIT